VFHGWIDENIHNCGRLFHSSNGHGRDQRCPFLALWMQQTAANGSKWRHKAKLDNRGILLVMMRHPATSSTPPQRAANDLFSASPETVAKTSGFCGLTS
jgi:hypothetical protein